MPHKLEKKENNKNESKGAGVRILFVFLEKNKKHKSQYFSPPQENNKKNREKQIPEALGIREVRQEPQNMSFLFFLFMFFFVFSMGPSLRTDGRHDNECPE